MGVCRQHELRYPPLPTLYSHIEGLSQLAIGTRRADEFRPAIWRLRVPADTPVHACRSLRRRSFAPWRVDRCGLSHSAANPCEFQVPVPRTIRHRRDGQKDRQYNGLPQCRVTAGESFPAHQGSPVRQTSGISDDRAACVQYWDQSLRAEFRAGSAHGIGQDLRELEETV